MIFYHNQTLYNVYFVNIYEVFSRWGADVVKPHVKGALSRYLATL